MTAVLGVGVWILTALGCAVHSPPESSRASVPRAVHLGPRPEFLVRDMDEGPLRDALMACLDRPVTATDFSIGHRGAPLLFPEHTRESYLAAARMGAGIIECDVTFTRDLELVCRHAQCDLHTTTDILVRPELAAKCSEPFEAHDPATGAPASASCCTSDITLAEFKSLCGKMDAFDPMARTAEEFLGGVADWRTSLHATCGTVLSHRESIDLIHGELGLKMTPELKSPEVAMPFEGFTQERYAQKMIDEYKAKGVDPSAVYPQSFQPEDVFYWLRAEPEFAERAVMLDGRYSAPGFDVTDPRTWKPTMAELRQMGVKILAPPIWMLLEEGADGRIIPSLYARSAREAGLEIITWTLERSGPLAAGGGWYYQTVGEAIDGDGDVMEVLRVLDQEVGVLGVFSDWPATVTFYAGCLR